MTETQAGGLRAITRDLVRSQIATEALRLFDERGFEETTVEDIAKAVGISLRSYFRYVPNKEDLVVGDLIIVGVRLRDEVATRLDTESPWEALCHGVASGAGQVDDDPATWLRIMRVISSTESLRARNLEKHLTWSALLVPLLTEHLSPDEEDPDLAARTLVGTVFAGLDAAMTTWSAANGRRLFRDTLDLAFAAIERTTRAR